MRRPAACHEGATDIMNACGPLSSQTAPEDTTAKIAVAEAAAVNAFCHPRGRADVHAGTTTTNIPLASAFRSEHVKQNGGSSQVWGCFPCTMRRRLKAASLGVQASPERRGMTLSPSEPPGLLHLGLRSEGRQAPRRLDVQKRALWAPVARSRRQQKTTPRKKTKDTQ